MTDQTQPVSGSNMATTTTVTNAEELQTASAAVATDLAHDAERDTRHALSHIEDEFISALQKLPLLTADLEAEGKKLLAWIASKV